MPKIYNQNIPENWEQMYEYVLRFPIAAPLLIIGPGYLYDYSYIVGKRQSRNHQFMQDPPRGWPSPLQTDFRNLSRWVALLWHNQDHQSAEESEYFFGPRPKSWWDSNPPDLTLNTYAGVTTWFRNIYPYTDVPVFSPDAPLVRFNLVKSNDGDSVFEPEMGNFETFQQWLGEELEIETWLLVQTTNCKHLRLSATRTFDVIIPNEAADVDVYALPSYDPDTVTWNTRPERGELIASLEIPSGNGHFAGALFTAAESVAICANLTWGQDPGDTTSILVDDIYLEPQG